MKKYLIVIICLLTTPALVAAHTTAGAGSGFVRGLLHPLSGVDHLMAMVAVGLWGAFLGTRAIWQLPIVFPMVMAIGAVFGIIGLPVPAVEIVVAGSSVILGAVVGLGVRTPIWVAAVVVGTFALFHGYAHGVELPAAASALPYTIGFVIVTGCLHLLGIVLGMLTHIPKGVWVVRSLGLIICSVGFWILLGLV